MPLPAPGADLTSLQARWCMSNETDPMGALLADWPAILKGNRGDLVELALSCFPVDAPADLSSMDRRRQMVGYLGLLHQSAAAAQTPITLRVLAAIETHTFPGWTAAIDWHHDAIQVALKNGRGPLVAAILAEAEPNRRARLYAHPLASGNASQFDTLVRLGPEPLSEAQWTHCALNLATYDHTPDTPHVYLGLLERFQSRLAQHDLVPWVEGNLRPHAQKTADGAIWDVRPNVPALATLLGPLSPTDRDHLIVQARARLEEKEQAGVDRTLEALAGPFLAWDRRAALQARPASRPSLRNRV